MARALRPRRRAALNVRLLITAAVALGLIVAGGVLGHSYRKRVLVQRALLAGQAAYARGDWENARVLLGRFVASRTDDCDVLAMYAAAQLALRPLPPDAIPQARGAYSRILRHRPDDEFAFRHLVRIYESNGQLAELEYAARRRAEARPDDLHALLCHARALLLQRALPESRARLEELVERGHAAGPGPAPVEALEACVLLARIVMESAPDDAATHREAGNWLEVALALDPQSPVALLARATWLRGAPRLDLAHERRAAALREARGALEQAEVAAFDDPRLHLRLCEEWLYQGDYARAQARIELARQAPAGSIDRYFLDPGQWEADLFVQAAKVLLVRGAPAGEKTELANAVIERLAGRPQRNSILPAAIELLASAGRPADARRGLEEYLAGLKLSAVLIARDERLAYLQAVVARAAGEPHRIVALLGPFEDAPTTRPLTRSLLAEAYLQTGQPGRALKILPAQDAGLDTAVLHAQALLRLGRWREALEFLSPLAAAQPGEIELQVQRITAELGAANEDGDAVARETLARVRGELTGLRDAHPQRADVRVLLATAAERLGEPDAAQMELRAGLADERCREPMRLRIALARLIEDDPRLDLDERLAQARAVLEEGCGVEPESATAWLALRDLWLRCRQAAEARAVLTRAATAVGAAGQPAIALAQALLELEHGDRAAAIAALRKLAGDDPQDVALRMRLIALPEVRADRMGAQAIVDQVRELEGQAGLRWRYAQALLWGGSQEARERAQAEELLRECRSADPSWAAPALLLGVLAERRGEFAAAELIYRQAYAQTASPEAGYALLRLIGRGERPREYLDLLNQLSRAGARGLTARRILAALEAGPEQALNETDPRLAGDERNPWDLLWRARHARARGDLNRALEYLRQASRLAPETIDFTREQALILDAAGRTPEADALLAKRVRDDPRFETRFLQAWFFQHTDRPARAEELYGELAQTADSAEGPELLGLHYAENGRMDDAIATWTAGLARFPKATALQRHLASARLVRGRDEDSAEARRLLTDLAAAAPDDLQLVYLQAAAQAGTHTPAGVSACRKLLRSALSAKPLAPPGTFRGLVNLALQLGEFELARDLAVRGLGQPADARDPELPGLLARVQLELGDLAQAAKLAQDALARRPDDVVAHEVALEAVQRQKDTQALRRGAGELDRLLAARPAQPALQVLRARACAALGEHERAVGHLETFIATDAGRSCPAALGLLADLYRRSPGETRRADEMVQRLAALLDDPTYAIALDDVPAFLGLGAWALSRGDDALAERVYRRVLQASPAQADALNNLAWLLAERPGADAAALSAALGLAERAVSVRPRDPELRDTLAAIYRRHDRPADAREQYRLCAERAQDEDLRTRDPNRRARLARVRALALLNLARTSFELHDTTKIGEYLAEARRLYSGFSPEQQAEIERLLAVVPRPAGT
ncbi:MAG: CDC27 family protein [Planctomycetota bacterium]